MKKLNLFNCILFLCFTLNIYNSYAQTAKEVVKGMGAGFNLGNVFDNGQKSTNFNDFKPIIDLYVAAGMTHIRIPTTWYDYVGGTRLTDVNGNINTSHPRFIELVKTVDYALSKGLYVVLNTHHEHWLKDYYDGSAYYNNIFTTLWRSIANYFKAYPSKLVFEVLNEPEGVMGQWGTPIIPTVQSGILYTRQINKVGYDAIRSTGGNNSTRIVMISPNGQANDSQIEEVYPNVSTLPSGNDQYLAMHVHSYDPWNFCGQTGANVNYPGVTQIRNDITVCNTHAQNNLGGIAVHYGEFGVGRETNQAERAAAVVTEYYQTFAKACNDLNIAFTVWDDRGWFALTNDAGNAFTYNIVPKMLEVVNAAPTVSITAPLTGTGFTFGTAINLAANASDVAPGTVSSVSFYDGATLLNTDTSSPYSFTWTGAAVGNHSITARATDNKGAVTTSTPVSITVNAVASNPLTLSYYHLVNRWTQDYMRPTAGGLTATITQYEEAVVPTFDSYQWEFQTVTGTNYFYIVNKYTQKAIQPTGGVNTNNTGLSQTTLTAANRTLPELHWSIVASNEAGYYWIQNRKSLLYIRPNAGTNGTGVAIVQNTLNTAQSSFRWSLVKLGDKPVANARVGTSISETNQTADFTKESQSIESSGTVDEIIATTIYPNPADAVIKLRTLVQEQATVNVTIYDVAGKPMITKKYENRVGWIQENIDVSELNAGNYVIKINKGAVLETKKLIKF